MKNRAQEDKEIAAAIRSGKRVKVPAAVTEFRAQLRASQSVTIRLAVDDIELAKTQAEQKGLPYQTYLKSVLHQALIAAR